MVMNGLDCIFHIFSALENESSIIYEEEAKEIEEEAKEIKRGSG